MFGRLRHDFSRITYGRRISRAVVSSHQRSMTLAQIQTALAADANANLTPVWREVARAIAAMGARHCFGLVGGANFKVTHALTELGVQFVAARHEGGAITMADV